MKKFLLALIACMVLSGCHSGVDLPLENEAVVFEAEVLEVNDRTLLVEGLDKSMKGKYYVSVSEGTSLEDYKKHDIVEIIFDGIVAESYPGQIRSDAIKVIGKSQYALEVDEAVDEEGLIHYTIYNYSGETKYTWIPMFQAQNDEGEWVDVEFISGACGVKDAIEESRSSSVPIDAFDFKKNSMVRLIVPVYDEENESLSEPDKELTHEFYLDIGINESIFSILEIHEDHILAEYAWPYYMTFEIGLDLNNVMNEVTSEVYKTGDRIEILYNEKETVEVSENKAVLKPISYSPSDWEPEEGVVYKPVIYLYPESVTDVEVTLDYDGELAVTYPEYEHGWSVTAYPDGTLMNHADGLEYSYLFWEGIENRDYDLSEGFVVKGEDTAKFLQELLPQFGLIAKEYNEMIVFWYPLMKNHAYNLISFQYDAYTDYARLNVSPQPDTVLRVFMVVKELDEPIDIKKQEIISIERKGFTVVEWGGTIIK